MAQAEEPTVAPPTEEQEKEFRQRALEIFDNWFPEDQPGREEVLAVMQPIFDDPFGRKQQQ